MARMQKNDNIQRGSRPILLSYSRIQSKQIQDGNLVSSDDVKSVRDLFIFGEKHCEPKSFGRMEAWISEERRKSKRMMRQFQHTGNFLGSLRAEMSNEVSYKFVPSPEFKPGSYFLLPESSPGSDYDALRFDRCVPSYTYIKPIDQLCRNNVMRREFCEVVGKELCVDCNGGKLRQKFNHKMDSLYPCLEYDKNKRPYGYCPRAIRLTEPLPLRVEQRPKSLNLGGRGRATFSGDIRGDIGGARRDGCDFDAPIKVFIKPRPYTS